MSRKNVTAAKNNCEYLSMYRKRCEALPVQSQKSSEVFHFRPEGSVGLMVRGLLLFPLETPDGASCDPGDEVLVAGPLESLVAPWSLLNAFSSSCRSFTFF